MRRDLIVSFSIIAGIMLVLSAGFSWLRGDLVSQSDQIAELRAAIARRSRSIAAYADLKNAAAEAARYESQLNAAFPTENQLLDMPRRVEVFAKSRSVIARFAFQGEPTRPTDTTAGSAAFAIDAEGKYDDLVQFVELLESPTQGFLATLDVFDLSRSTGDRYRLSGRGRTFFRAPLSGKPAQ